MKVAVLTLCSFPEGMASTNRVFYHAKGLIDNGIEAKVFIIKKTEMPRNVKNINIKGVYNGVPFEYALNETVRSKYFIQRRIDDILGPILGAIKVITGKYDAGMLISSNSFYHPMLFKIIFKLFGIKFIAERTEMMFLDKKQHGIYKIKNWIYERVIYKNIPVFLTISYSLQEKYKKLVSKNSPVLLIPVLIDEKDIYRPEIIRTKDLVYTGPLVQKKDGILTIIESFIKIAPDFPETRLVMTGNIEKTPERENIMKLVDNSPYSDRMIFKGFVTREDMITLLNSAAGLLLAKPSSDQADTCFPTKLGEYLTSGNPIVVTKTGEIPLYLEDGVSAYISEPDSVDSFASKLRDLLSDNEKARKIGMKGRETAIEKFNYAENTKKVIKALDSF
jgi:glycosyltransferase involved in cell wall biosynthesis